MLGIYTGNNLHAQSVHLLVEWKRKNKNQKKRRPGKTKEPSQER